MMQFNYELTCSDGEAKVTVVSPTDPEIPRIRGDDNYGNQDINVRASIEIHSIDQLRLTQMLSALSEIIHRQNYDQGGGTIDREEWFSLRFPESDKDNSPGDSADGSSGVE